MGLLYKQFNCNVIVDGDLSDWFSVEAGVRQGSVIPNILFLAASLIELCVGQWRIDTEAYGGHSFPDLKMLTLQMT